MSEEQLAALVAKLNDDPGLREKLEGSSDLDAFIEIAKEAGFDVSKADWLKYQKMQTLELSDAELESAAGGTEITADTLQGGTNNCYTVREVGCNTGPHSCEAPGSGYK